MPNVQADAFLDLLENERAAIRNSRFEALDQINDEKTRTFELLSAAQLPQAQLERIQKELAHNQSLLSAAISGVSAARARIDALKNVRDGLSVYDQSGQMSKVTTNRPDLEKKA